MIFKDLLDARKLITCISLTWTRVYATAIGRYLIRNSDRNSKDLKHHTAPESLGTRTLYQLDREGLVDGRACWFSSNNG